VGATGMPEAAGHSRWEALSSPDGIVSETIAYLTGAHQLLDRLGKTIDPAADRLTFVEVEDAIRCVSRALLALGADRPGPASGLTPAGRRAGSNCERQGRRATPLG
jgi:hypothetical protein